MVKSCIVFLFLVIRNTIFFKKNLKQSCAKHGPKCIELMMTWYKYGGGFTHMRGRLFENCQKYPRYKVSITLKISKIPNPNPWSVKNIMISRLNFRFTLYYWGKFGGPKITIFRIKFSNVVERNVRHFLMNDLYLVADKLKLQLCQIQKFIYSEKATKFLRNLHLRFDCVYCSQI